MNLHFHFRGMSSNRAIQTHLEEKLGFALSGVSQRILRVDAFFSDHNGDKGGDDKSLRLLVHLKGQPEIVIESRGSEINQLIDCSCDRLGQTAHRQWDRVLAHQHRREGLRNALKTSA